MGKYEPLVFLLVLRDGGLRSLGEDAKGKVMLGGCRSITWVGPEVLAPPVLLHVS